MVQPFGYRDIYQTPSSKLYRALGDGELPTTGRHYDWQLWGEDAAPNLKTLMPWDEQPDPVASYLDDGFFQLRRPELGNDDEVEEAERNPALRPEVNVNFPSITEVEKGLQLREYSYAHPLDVQMEKAIPINAPPVDTLLNLQLDSVPVISLSVLTPTEVRRLQKDYHDMRNLVLSRTERCPYAGCDAKFPASKPAALQQHLVSNHSALFSSLETQPSDDAVHLSTTPRTDGAREGRWKFCARCGRDHTVLNAGADRAHHDSVCYPGAQDREVDWTACRTCGDHIARSASVRPSAASQQHKHREDVDTTGQPFCEECGLAKGRFSEGYRKKHEAFCKGHGRDNAKFCPWCGIELGWDFLARAQHIEQCGRKPDAPAQGPIDVKTASYFLSGGQRTSSTSTGKDTPDKSFKSKKRKEPPVVMATIPVPPKR